jgi:mRNA-degrading endonuclease YafQ of YafQ-DinJ toxin-antitoxin module
MPTYEWAAEFARDYSRLTAEQREAFKRALEKFVADLVARRPFRRSLRVRGVQRAAGVFEMTWAPDGRATFEYGESVRQGHTHIIWRRIGTHDVLNEA